MKVTFIGVGVMGGAILSAYLGGEGIDPHSVTAVVPSDAHAVQLRNRFGDGIAITTDIVEGAQGADAILLAVKPKDVGGVLARLKGVFERRVISSGSSAPLLITVAAGLKTSVYEEQLGEFAVIRAMPNTPVQVGLGITALSAGKFATAAHLALAREIFTNTGEVIVVDEKDQDAVSAISGSGPAYIFSIIDAMAEAGVLLGLKRPVALKLAAQTVLGTGQMALEGLAAEPVVPPSTLREQVTSPGGTTARALFELDKAGVRAAFIAAAQAAWNRSKEL
jgi:pyrroline-5-carboxylate reductase